MSSDSASQFSGRRYINLESYKKDGKPVLTPVQSIEDNGLVYLRTDPKTWKVKRIRRNPHVRIAPSDRKGNPIGTWVDGRAQVLEGGESDRVMTLFKKEYGTVGNSMVNFVGRLRGERLTTIISIELEPQQT
jgi:PPOX class probable F420-dependent enzyme